MKEYEYIYKKYSLNLRLDKPNDKRISDFIEANGGNSFIRDAICGLMGGAILNITPVPLPIIEESIFQEETFKVDAEENKDDLFEGFL